MYLFSYIFFVLRTEKTINKQIEYFRIFFYLKQKNCVISGLLKSGKANP